MLESVGSRELKNKTGEILGRVRRGERIRVTNRGQTVAVLVPASDLDRLEGPAIRPYEEAWPEITTTLAESAPEYESW
jgi:prevent-host-death family protein